MVKIIYKWLGSFMMLLWSWSHGSWIYNYLCNQHLLPLKLWVPIPFTARCTISCDKVSQFLTYSITFRICYEIHYTSTLYWNHCQRKGHYYDLVWFMVFNATFNNITAILWQSVLLVEKTRVPGDNINHWPASSRWQTLSQNV